MVDFVVALRLAQRWAGAALVCAVQASCRGGFSCCRAQARGMQASVVAACGLSSCGAQAYLLRSLWDLHRPGIERVSLALQSVSHSTTREATLFLYFYC